MALEQQIQEQNMGTPLSDEEELDLKIGVLMAEHMLMGGGMDAIETAVNSSSDPGQAVGQFLLQMGQQLMESMPDDMKLSPKILLCKGGWLEQVSDFIQEEGGVKKSIMDKAEIYVAHTAQQMAAAKQQQGGGQVDGVQAPPAPGPGAPAPTMPQPAGGV
jgi:hypothetical protein